jgi:type II secretory pathway component PulC
LPGVPAAAHSPGVRATTFCCLLCLSACGASAPEPARTPAPVAAKPAVPVAARSAPSTTLARKDVVGFVDSGFANFLQRVQVEPSLADGRFRGWTIVDLRPTNFWTAVDLKPGDVVTSVNGMPIERDTEAWDAFESLRTASELRVAYDRNGASRTLAYRIVD